MYAVIETGGKQYRVEVGTELSVELLDVEPGKTITLDRVLLVADGDTATIGRPMVDGAAVSAEVVRQARGEKLISFKYRPKARSRVKKGHRQELTVLRINDIVVGGKSAAKAAAKAETDAKTERQRIEEAATEQAAKDAALAAKLDVGATGSSASTTAPAKKATPAKKTDAKATPAKSDATSEPSAKSAASEKAAATSKTTKAAPKKSTSAAKPKSTAAKATTDPSASKPATKKPATKRATKKDE
jgi:large subunit ribosomal protein L21